MALENEPEVVTYAYVDRVELDTGYVSLTSGHVCEIVACLNKWGDEVPIRAGKAVQGVIFQLPTGEPHAFPLDGFQNPTIH